MNVLKRFAMLLGLGAAAAASTAQADDWGVTLHGGNWHNGWSVSYRDHDHRPAYGNGYGYGYGYSRAPSYGYGYGVRRAPGYYTPYRQTYYRDARYRDYDHRSYSRRAPWCPTHRAYHVHSVGSSYARGYSNGYSDGYRDGRDDDYGSASYYDRIDEMAYDTSIYYGRRW